MKVILKQDIKSIGKKDQIINVADGYAKNYLFPKNLAVLADAGNMNNLKAKKESEIHRKNEDLKASQELAEKMKKITINFSVKAGENGRLFGTITAKEIAEKLKEEYHIEVDKKKIVLPNGIKVAGITQVEIKLNEGVVATLAVKVTTV